MNLNIADDWKSVLADEFEKPYFAKLCEFVENEYETATIYPTKSNIFRAFDKCSFDNLKVVIIGQDPYHGPNQANGLCFSVSEGVAIPPSLKNIFKEVHADIGVPIPESGNLDRWAEQGVLLLNAVLTVRAHEAASHAVKGWEIFTEAVVDAIASKKQNVVYMAWGSFAQKRCAVVNQSENCLLKSVHPSPLSAYRGFLGCRHFSQANQYLESVGKNQIEW
ncbi:MAG: uracil-DNA glycosylase [Rikenellaceae bacterium]